MQPQSRPGERQLDLAWRGVAQPLVGADVHGGVEQRGVQAEPSGVRAYPLGQLDLGEDLLAPLGAPPGCAQPAERRPVRQPGAGQGLVHAVDVRAVDADSLGVRGRPGRQGLRRRRVRRRRLRGSGIVGGQIAADVAGPAVGAGFLAVRPRVDRDRPAPRPVRRTDDDLHLDAEPLGQHQRSLGDQLVDGVVSGDLTGVQGELDEHRARDDHGSHHVVVGEPGVGVQGEAAGEDGLVGVGGGEGGA